MANDRLQSSIFSVLNGDSALTALVGDRIYPVKALQGIEFPYIVFSRISGQIGIHMQGASNDREARIQFDVFTKNYPDLDDIRDRLHELLHGRTSTLGSTTLWVGINQNDEESYVHQNDTFEDSLDFVFKYEVSPE